VTDWTDTQVTTLRTLHTKGRTCGQIGKVMGRSQQAITAAVRRYITRPIYTWPEEDKLELAKMHAAGKPVHIMAKMLGRTPCAVRGALSRQGLYLREINMAGYRRWVVRDAIRTWRTDPEARLIAGYVAEANRGTQWGDQLAVCLGYRRKA
jgi:IS30 family transposase